MTQTTYLLTVNSKPICTGTLATLQALTVQIPAENNWSIREVYICSYLMFVNA
jgi:hypothetical protein